ncbi:MAG: TonB-dependent receptor, partial [Pseudomonadota bacterium]
NCYNRQVPDGLVVNGLRLCDYTGNTGQYTPENSASLALDYNHPFNAGMLSGMVLDGSLMYNYRSSQLIHDNQDPNMEIDSVGRLNARIGLTSNNWDLALVGKNLTNEKVLTYAGNV